MYLHEDKEQFKEAVNLAVYKSGLEPEVIEKDYYVTMVLKKLSERFDFSVFKGGTSLQKCHRIICRFSEDIDITIEHILSQRQKRDLKYGVISIAADLGMTVSNIDSIKSRRDYNCYELSYESILDKIAGIVQSSVLLETSFSEIAFPVITLPVHSYIGDLFEKEAPKAMEQYDLSIFSMKVQDIDRTLIDKVFAICDYYLKRDIKKHSRHIYDIYKLLQVVPQDRKFQSLIKEVRALRAKTNICPAAMPGVDVTALLYKIVEEDIYKEDYHVLTARLLEEKVSYEEAIASIKDIADSGIFDE